MKFPTIQTVIFIIQLVNWIAAENFAMYESTKSVAFVGLIIVAFICGWSWVYWWRNK